MNTGKHPHLGAPRPLPTLHAAGQAAQAAFTSGWWHGAVIGFVLGMATAVLMGWLK